MSPFRWLSPGRGARRARGRMTAAGGTGCAGAWAGRFETQKTQKTQTGANESRWKYCAGRRSLPCHGRRGRARFSSDLFAFFAFRLATPRPPTARPPRTIAPAKAAPRPGIGATRSVRPASRPAMKTPGRGRHRHRLRSAHRAGTGIHSPHRVGVRGPCPGLAVGMYPGRSRHGRGPRPRPSVFRVVPHRASGARGPSGIVSRFGRVPFLRPGRKSTRLGGVGRVKDRRPSRRPRSGATTWERP